MFESSEVINLLSSILFLYILFRLFHNKSIPLPHSILLGILFILSGSFFTIIEGFIYPKLFNIMEHFSFTLAAISFLIGSVKILRSNG